MTAEFDMNQLEEMTGGDPDLTKELMQSFYECADECIASLESCINGDPTNWKEHAHALKGIALNFGATGLSDISKQAEEQALTLNDNE
ncbi:MAG: Hpt domain-containing protein, partial [Alphaproteobacteria bacterium]